MTEPADPSPPDPPSPPTSEVLPPAAESDPDDRTVDEMPAVEVTAAPPTDMFAPAPAAAGNDDWLTKIGRAHV